ncbi:MAG: hypothetical protein NVS4B8_07680 [Herpetosiphon sp.]
MRFSKGRVEPTLFMNQVGVLVETLEHHAFPVGGQQPRSGTEEVQPPAGAAVVAVQFVHELRERFKELQCFRLTYHHRAPSASLMEDYLAVPYDRLVWAAQPVDAQSLSADQRAVLTRLLSASDTQAWEASTEFRALLEGKR